MVKWIVENWSLVVNIVLSAVVLAGYIAKTTPTKVDDEIVAKIDAILDSLVGEKKESE